MVYAFVGEKNSLRAAIRALPGAQRNVVRALLAGDGQTYQQVGLQLGLCRGTVSRYLLRVRQRHPASYIAIMEFRGRQLESRHQAALARAAERTRLWCFSQARRRYRDAAVGKPHGPCGWEYP